MLKIRVDPDFPIQYNIVLYTILQSMAKFCLNLHISGSKIFLDFWGLTLY